jgi:hypothetical protein
VEQGLVSYSVTENGPFMPVDGKLSPVRMKDGSLAKQVIKCGANYVTLEARADGEKTKHYRKLTLRNPREVLLETNGGEPEGIYARSD